MLPAKGEPKPVGLRLGRPVNSARGTREPIWGTPGSTCGLRPPSRGGGWPGPVGTGRGCPGPALSGGWAAASCYERGGVVRHRNGAGPRPPPLRDYGPVVPTGAQVPGVPGRRARATRALVEVGTGKADGPGLRAPEGARRAWATAGGQDAGPGRWWSPGWALPGCPPPGPCGPRRPGALASSRVAVGGGAPAPTAARPCGRTTGWGWPNRPRSPAGHRRHFSPSCGSWAHGPRGAERAWPHERA